MLIILKFFTLQLRNFWHSLGLRIKIELLILLIIFYAFFSEQLVHLFNSLLLRPSISPLGLNSFAGHFISLSICSAIPFIYFKLLPRQSGIKIFLSLPINTVQALTLFLLYLSKYQLAVLVFTGPVVLALLITTNFLAVIYLICVILILPILGLLSILSLNSVLNNHGKIIALYLTGMSVYFLIHFYLYLNMYPYILFDVFILLLLTASSVRSLIDYGQHWDKSVLAATTQTKPPRRRIISIVYRPHTGFFAPAIRAYLLREVISRLRNATFLRMYILRLILLIVVLIVGIMQQQTLIPLICFVFCWLHYNHQFNEKYIVNDSYDFIHTSPIRYGQIWLAYFLAEYIWFLPVLIICSIAFIVSTSSIWVYLVFISVTTAILKLIITIRLMFLDNNRLAGYAYHLFIVFSLIMVFNFYLVGPVVIIGLLIYIVYLSYRRFAY